jgi:hypothetical protein
MPCTLELEAAMMLADTPLTEVDAVEMNCLT